MTTQFTPTAMDAEDAEFMRALLESQEMELKQQNDRYASLEAEFQEMSTFAMSCEDRTRKLTEELARISSRHMGLERDLNEMTLLRDRYLTKAQEEQQRAEELTNEWKSWQKIHSSCEDKIERLSDEASRAAALESRNHELEQALESSKSETDELRGNMFELYQTHSLCEDAITSLTEEVSRAAALESRNHELEEELESMMNKYKNWKVEVQRRHSEAPAYDYQPPLQQLKRTSSSAAHAVQFQHERNYQTQEAEAEPRYVGPPTEKWPEMQRTHSESSAANLSETSSSSQQFLAPGDVGTVSAADVITLVERLNSNISLCAAQLAESLPGAQLDDDSDLESEATQSVTWVDMGTKPYAGPRRKLVVGIDVGTTLSGVSYSILDPGVVPVVNGVNRYPSQEKVGGDAKIPSVIYYDSGGSVCAVGAEALQESNVELARERGWFKCQSFKLHLYSLLPGDEQLLPLPPNKTIVEVLGDFFHYLSRCTRSYIEETHASGVGLWEFLEADTDFVLTHPNDWQSTQQAQLLRAAIHGRLVPDTPEGWSRIHFLKDGEASLHHCIRNNYVSDIIKSGDGVILLDAGGATLCLSTFCIKESRNWYEEITPSTCHFRGSAFISRCAHDYLERKLNGSCYGTPEDIDLFTECFDKTTKSAFKDSNELCFIKFGTARENEPSVDVKFGQLRLQGSDVATFFQPSISTLQQAIEEHLDCTPVPVTTVLMVGGFAASDWLFSNVQGYLGTKNIRLSRPDGQLGKSVANGAVSFFVDQFITRPIKKSTRRGVKLIPQELTAEEDANDASPTAAAQGDIQKWAGDAAIRLLTQAHTLPQPPLAVHIAVQACMVSYCNHLVTCWDRDLKLDDTFRRLYRDLLDSVAPSIARKWRALTKSGFNKQYMGDVDRDVTTFISTRLPTIMALAGYHDDPFGMLVDTVSDRLRSISKSVLELRSAIGEKTLLCDMETFLFPCGVLFDEKMMQDELKTQKHDDDVGAGPILCTTELGLRLSRVMETGNQTLRVEDVLLMPKVVLREDFGDILDT